MPKILINLGEPQSDWLRAEAERLGLPGGVSELLRRIIDERRTGAQRPTTAPQGQETRR